MTQSLLCCGSFSLLNNDYYVNLEHIHFSNIKTSTLVAG